MNWNSREVDVLRRSYGSLPKGELLVLLPGRTWTQVLGAVQRFRLRRLRVGERVGDEMRRLYSEGLSDAKVAVAVGVCQNTVFQWRTREGLSANGRRRRVEGFSAPRVRRLSEAPLSYDDGRTSDEMYNVYSSEESEFLRAIASWRQRHGRLPTLLDGLRIAKSIGWTIRG